MNNTKRSALFAQYVGLELKGRIVTQGFTARGVANGIHRQASNMSSWLNGKREIPISVLCEVCELIKVEPRSIVDAAYDRMVFELGELDGSTYEDDEPSNVTPLTPRISDDSDFEDASADEVAEALSQPHAASNRPGVIPEQEAPDTP